MIEALRHIDTINPLRNKNDFLNIPIDLLGYAIRWKKVNQVKLFIVLKTLFNYRFICDRETINLICKVAGYKQIKTFESNFKWLVSHKWVTFCKKYCAIKGYNKLKINKCFMSRKGVQFTPAYDLEHFRAFIYGAVITYCMKRKWFLDRESGIEKRSPVKRSRRKPVSYNLPLSYLSAILNISKSSVSNYKRIAEEAGYINYKKDYEKLENISPRYFYNYKMYSDIENFNKLRVVNGVLCIQQPDKITTNMVVKTKRNMRKKT